MFVNFRLFFKHCQKIFCFYSWHFQYQTANLQTLQSHSFEAPLRFSRLETPSSKVSRIENQVLSLDDWDATDCQLTFERYCRMPEQESGVQFLFVNGTLIHVCNFFLGTWKFSCFYSWCRPTGAVFVNKNLIPYHKVRISYSV